MGSKFVNEVFTVFKIPRLESRRSFISLNEMAEKMAIPTSSTCHFEAVEDIIFIFHEIDNWYLWISLESIRMVSHSSKFLRAVF